jgi:hypothetical protein
VTLAQALERGRALVARWWALPALLVVVALVLAWRLDSGRRSALEAARLAEEARAKAAGLLVAEQSKGKTLEAEAKRLAAAIPDLEAALAKARAALPGAKVSGTASSSTGPRPAGGDPRPGPVCPAAPGAPPAPVCLLAAGDEGEIRVDQVVLTGPAGATVLVGAASAYRVTPEPRTRLFGGPFRAELSTAKVASPPPPPGWGAGALVLGGRSGWAVGPAIAPPPVQFWGLRFELLAGAAVGPGGEWSTMATGLVRF